ncbi:MAG: GNAT family N-acetyltransferase [Rhizobiaceae bacterium]
MPLSVEPFEPARHTRSDFQSGTAGVDSFLKLTAKKLANAHAAAVFVVADSDDNIVGYYVLAAIVIDASDISTDKASKLFGRFGAVPATLLSFLGVDQRWQGQGIGKMLLADALRRSFEASRQVGSFCVVLDVLDDGDPENMAKRVALYEGVGFRRCDTDKGMRMFLTMRDIEANAG